MNQAYGWMGGGTLMWAVLGILVVVVVNKELVQKIIVRYHHTPEDRKKPVGKPINWTMEE